MGILLAVVISEKLPGQVILAGANLSSVGSVVIPQLLMEGKVGIIIGGHYRTSTSSDSESKSVILTLMVPQSSGIS